MSILEVKNLTYYYEDSSKEKREILHDVNFSFDKNTFYAIVGESGSGKTTFLSLISALSTPKEGKVLYLGKDIKEIGYENYRRNCIGIIFQDFNLIQYLTAVENVLVAMEITDNEMPKNKKEEAYRILESLGIDKKTADRRVNKLSGGEQQRVAIARAVATNVDIIVADEPTGNLDHDTSEIILDLFMKLAHELGKCVIVVTHDKNISEKSDITMNLNYQTKNFDVEDNMMFMLADN